MAQSGGSIGGYSPWALEKSRACGDQVDEKASSRRGRLSACSKVHKLIEPETTSTARSASAVRVLSAVSARVRSATSTRVADGAGWGGEAGPSARASFKLSGARFRFKIETNLNLAKGGRQARRRALGAEPARSASVRFVAFATASRHALLRIRPVAMPCAVSGSMTL